MPYIKQDRRDFLDRNHSLEGVEPKGDLNYIIFSYAKRYIKPSYNNYKELIGELESCKLEIYRKLVAPYEETKILENGDI